MPNNLGEQPYERGTPQRLGENDSPVEEALQHSFDNTVNEGAERLQRTFRAMLVTGFFGGMEVGLGVMAYLAVLHETDNHLLAGLAFSVGLIAILLAHSELFTEDFLMPVAAVVSREGSVAQLGKLWGGTLVANLAGGWVFMWLVMQAFPEWESTIRESAAHFVDAPFSLQTICLAILGGIALVTVLRLVRTKELVQQRRRESPADPDAARGEQD